VRNFCIAAVVCFFRGLDASIGVVTGDGGNDGLYCRKFEGAMNEVDVVAVVVS